MQIWWSLGRGEGRSDGGVGVLGKRGRGRIGMTGGEVATVMMEGRSGGAIGHTIGTEREGATETRNAEIDAETEMTAMKPVITGADMDTMIVTASNAIGHAAETGTTAEIIGATIEEIAVITTEDATVLAPARRIARITDGATGMSENAPRPSIEDARVAAVAAGRPILEDDSGTPQCNRSAYCCAVCVNIHGCGHDGCLS
jgi:hypothetical protein